MSVRKASVVSTISIVAQKAVQSRTDTLVSSSAFEAAGQAAIDNNMNLSDALTDQQSIVSRICHSDAHGDLVGMSVQGRAHFLASKENQDNFYAWSENGMGSIVLCDGIDGGAEDYAKCAASILSKVVGRLFKSRAGQLCDLQADKIRAFLEERCASFVASNDTYREEYETETVQEDWRCSLVGIFWTPTGHAMFQLGAGRVVVEHELADRSSDTKVSQSCEARGSKFHANKSYHDFAESLDVTIGGPVRFVTVTSGGMEKIIGQGALGDEIGLYLPNLARDFECSSYDKLDATMFERLSNPMDHDISTADKTLVTYFRKPNAAPAMASIRDALMDQRGSTRYPFIERPESPQIPVLI